MVSGIVMVSIWMGSRDVRVYWRCDPPRRYAVPRRLGNEGAACVLYLRACRRPVRAAHVERSNMRSSSAYRWHARPDFDRPASDFADSRLLGCFNLRVLG